MKKKTTLAPAVSSEGEKRQKKEAFEPWGSRTNPFSGWGWIWLVALATKTDNRLG